MSLTRARTPCLGACNRMLLSSFPINRRHRDTSLTSLSYNVFVEGLKEQHVLITPPKFQQCLMYALFQRLRTTDKHHSIASAKTSSLAMLLQQRRSDPPPQPFPILRCLRKGIEQFTPLRIISREAVKISLAENVFQQTVTIQDDALRRIRLILHHGAEDLVYGRDAAAATDHQEFLHLALRLVDEALSVSEVFELADGAFEVYEVSEGERVHGQTHLAAFPLRCVEVDFHQDVHRSPL